MVTEDTVLVTGGSGFIGTVLMDELTRLGFKAFNLDVLPPRKQDQADRWIQGDVLVVSDVEEACQRTLPRACIHLAAETEITDSDNVEVDFAVNANAAPTLLRALGAVGCSHAILASTQFVCGPDASPPATPTDYAPHTAYGQSKVLMEQAIRGTEWSVPWTIVRPTYVWGPWSLGRFLELVRTIQALRYRHPSGPPVIRSYGYVGNVVSQLAGLLGREEAYGGTYYLGEPSCDSRVFVDSLSVALTGKPVRSAPRWLLRSASLAGDVTKLIPLDSFRYGNLTKDYRVSMESTVALLGSPPISMGEAAANFAGWLEERDARLKGNSR